MDKLQACKETKELWTAMARFAREKNQLVLKSEIEGPWLGYIHKCPCCEYTERPDCSRCPMLHEWRVYSDHEVAPCETFSSPSPYAKWKVLCYKTKAPLCIDVAFFCLLIAEMAEEAIERLRCKGQVKKVKN